MNTEEALPDEMLMDPVATGCKIKTPCCDNRVFNKDDCHEIRCFQSVLIRFSQMLNGRNLLFLAGFRDDPEVRFPSPA